MNIKVRVVGLVVLTALSLAAWGAVYARDSRIGSKVQSEGKPESTGKVQAINLQTLTINGRQMVISDTTEVKAQLQVGDLVKVHAVQQEDGSLMVSEVELAQGNDEVSTENEQGETEFFGVVEAIGDGSWIIDGKTVTVTDTTEIKDTIQVGDLVKVHAWVNDGGTFTAREIELADDDVADDIDDDDDVDDDDDGDHEDDDGPDDDHDEDGDDDHGGGNGIDDDGDDHGNDHGAGGDD